ncbi:SGNH/GDSL hydrolase family protein [Candidatus Pacearchaeota archaeon]|nr:SGNH/GDSL hydrolase family protein [Candidatus Pacearchaeota archaeon]
MKKTLITLIAALLVLSGYFLYLSTEKLANVEAPSDTQKEQNEKVMNYENDMIPLTDLKTSTYKGYEGGLYPDGENSPPQDYLPIGLRKSSEIKPLDEKGLPASDGKIVLLTTGMSNVAQESKEFIQSYKPKNKNLIIVNGAQGGVDAVDMSGFGTEKSREEFNRYWNEILPDNLEKEGVDAKQVQVVWLKQALSSPGLNEETKNFPDDANELKKNLLQITKILEQKFPNLKIIYISSRTYAGCAKTPKNPEPYAYQSGFAVKWLIEDFIKEKENSSVWIAWGPYIWADGETPRGDGLVYFCSDFREDDGTHPSEAGQKKVARLLNEFFSTEVTSKNWYN